MGMGIGHDVPMVSKPTSPNFLAAEPQDIAPQLEACVRLWIASCRASFWYALACGIVGLLPAFAMAGVSATMMRFGLDTALAAFAPRLAALRDPLTPAAILASLGDWLLAPGTWLSLLGSSLLTLVLLTPLIHRQHRIGLGSDPGLAAATATGLRRAPACVGAWLVYLMGMFALCLPLLALTWIVFHFSIGTDAVGLMMLMLLFMLGSALLSVPLCWFSVAAGLAPFASAIEGAGPIAAQWRSIGLVRGHWMRCAIVVSVPMLVYLGIGSLVSSLTLLCCGAIAVAWGGWTALLQSHWLLAAQLLALVPMALALPLAFTGGTVCLHDLTRRQQPT